MPESKKTSPKKKEKELNPKGEKVEDAKPLSPLETTNLSKEYARQFYWIVGTLAVLIIIFFGAYTFFQSLSHFTFQGLSFTKEKLGTIPIYHYYYYFPTDTGAQKQFNLYLREDPRKNPVPVEGDILFPPKSEKVYVSISPTDFQNCTRAVGSYASLASFIMGHEYNISPGTPSQYEAISTNTTFLNCYTNPGKTVILITTGNESKITKENSCYKLEVAKCDLLSVAEKFMTQTIIDSRNEAIKTNTLITVTPVVQNKSVASLPNNTIK